MIVGFNKWNRRDYLLFIKGVEKYGRDNVRQIARDIEGKTMEEVEEYNKVFWDRWHELNDFEKIKQQVERGEAKALRRAAAKQALANKIARYRSPYYDCKITYNQNKSKVYTEDDDKFLLCALNEIGLDNENAYEELRNYIRSTDQNRFNWFMRSRTAWELQRRCNTLVSLIQKETDHDGRKQSEPRRRSTKVNSNDQANQDQNNAETEKPAEKKRNSKKPVVEEKKPTGGTKRKSEATVAPVEKAKKKKVA